jgi:flavodoxin
MKAHVVYDSAYGNTKAVADAVVQGLQSLHAAAVSVTDAKTLTTALERKAPS